MAEMKRLYEAIREHLENLMPDAAQEEIENMIMEILGRWLHGDV